MSVNTIQVIEEDGVDIPIGKSVNVVISNHWNVGQFVVLEIKGVKVTVNSYDLQRAISNATN